MKWVSLSFLYLAFSVAVAGCGVTPEDYLGNADSNDDDGRDHAGKDADTSGENEGGDSELYGDTMPNTSTDADEQFESDSEITGRTESDSIYTLETDIVEGTDSFGIQYGHWTCEDEACHPVYESDFCGDGVCSPIEGESDQSCPGDCLRGEDDMSCTSPIDCVFLEWQHQEEGWWECVEDDHSDRGICKAFDEDDWCDDQDGDCTIAEGESHQSCPADCREVESCENAVDCLFNSWPG